MDNQNQNGSRSIDDILEELRSKGSRPAAPVGSQSVDDILAEMGIGGRQALPRRPAQPAAAAPPPAKVPVPEPAASPVEPSPVTPAPPQQAAQPEVLQPQPAPSVARSEAELWEGAAAPAPPDTIPAATDIPDPTPAAAEWVTEAAAQEDSVLWEPAGAAQAEPAFEDTATWEEAPAAIAEETPDFAPEPPVRVQKPVSDSTSIWDIQTVHSAPMPRVGKAAALDQVDTEKYQDEELLNWYSGENQLYASKRDQRRAEKERKREEATARKQAAAEEKAQRKRARRGEQDEAEPADEQDALPTFMSNAPLEEVAPLTPFIEDEPQADAWEPTPDQPAELYTAEETTVFYTAEATANSPVYDAPTPQAPQPTINDPEPATNPADAWDNTADADFTPALDQAAPFPGESLPVGDEAAFQSDTLPDTATPATVAPEAPVQDLPNPAQPSGAAIDEWGPPPMATQPFGAQAPPVQPSPAGVDTAPDAVPPEMSGDGASFDTQSYDVDEVDAQGKARVPSAKFTQEFAPGDVPPTGETAKAELDATRSLYIDEVAQDERFRVFFENTVAVDAGEVEQGLRKRRKRKKQRSAILTGEFSKLAEQAEQAELGAAQGEEALEDYNHLQQAGEIEADIVSLCKTLTLRSVFSFVISLLLFWLGLGLSGALPLPALFQPATNPVVFSSVYLGLLVIAIGINFTTVASGLVGLVGEQTVDSAPAVAAVGGLLQAVVLLVQSLGTTGMPAGATLFGGLIVLLLAFNAIGKRMRAQTILSNFRLTSSGHDHSAAWVLDNSQELAYSIADGLDEPDPTLLISRPTALVRGFIRQSFSQRAADRTGRTIGWVLFGFALIAGALTYFFVQPAEAKLFSAVTAFAALLAIGTPLSSTLVSAVPGRLLQKGTARVGAVVPGWSAIEELGQVNVVMAGSHDIFPPSVVYLKGIKTFEKERVDLAILYAASVLVEACDTLRDIFLGVIQGKSDMLYKVESLTREPGRGFTAWVQNSRVVVGTREMLQKHAITPPSIEIEMKYVPDGYHPLYLAVSGKLFAMFIVGYGADPEVHETLKGLVRSGVSLLISSDDPNVTGELVERTYGLPHGVIKVLGRRELDILEPIMAYQHESDGVMAHLGSFASFIGGMRAAASCAAAEHMSSIVQIASVLLACTLSLLLVFSGALAGLSAGVTLLYQLGWTLLICALPFVRKY